VSENFSRRSAQRFQLESFASVVKKGGKKAYGRIFPMSFAETQRTLVH